MLCLRDGDAPASHPRIRSGLGLPGRTVGAVCPAIVAVCPVLPTLGAVGIVRHIVGSPVIGVGGVGRALAQAGPGVRTTSGTPPASQAGGVARRRRAGIARGIVAVVGGGATGAAQDRQEDDEPPGVMVRQPVVPADARDTIAATSITLVRSIQHLPTRRARLPGSRKPAEPSMRRRLRPSKDIRRADAFGGRTPRPQPDAGLARRSRTGRSAPWGGSTTARFWTRGPGHTSLPPGL